jgi:hypothetical protein
MEKTNREVAGTIVDKETAEKLTLAAQQEIDEISGSTHNFQYQTMTIEKDGKLIEIEVPIDDIELLDDFDDEDLSTEGERASGIIPNEYDTTINNIATEKAIRNSIKYGELIVDEDGGFLIKCPYTGSTEVYQIDSSTYASFETDQAFKINFNLSDFRPDQS